MSNKIRHLLHKLELAEDYELQIAYTEKIISEYDRLEKAALKLREEMKRHALFLKPSDLYMCMEMEVSITEFDEAIKGDES